MSGSKSIVQKIAHGVKKNSMSLSLCVYTACGVGVMNLAAGTEWTNLKHQHRALQRSDAISTTPSHMPPISRVLLGARTRVGNE
jgi:hypothetical protein